MADVYREHRDIERIENGDISRQDIRDALAKTVELRALRAALMAGESPANLRFSAASPVSRHTRNLSAQDYPVFTPSYNDEPLRGYQHIPVENIPDIDETFLSGHKKTYQSSRKPSRSQTMDFESHICPSDGLGASTGLGYSKSRQNSVEDIQSVSSCNKCRPAIISVEPDGTSVRKSNIVVPMIDSHLTLHPKLRNKNVVLSWLFPKLRKKNNNENSIARAQTDEIPQMLSDLGIVSVETLRKELIEANASKNAALNEVAEVKSSVGELKEKLEYLETYCEELKKASTRTAPVKNPPNVITSIENEEVKLEGFLKIVSEARLSVKQFCETLLVHVEENDDVALVDNLNSMLEPYKLFLNSKYSKAVSFHLEAFVNRSLHQDFENCVFRKNGARKLLDPPKDIEARFQSFVSLRNLSWSEVLRKGTKFYSEDFSKFCDEKMSGIVTVLGCTRPWPEELLQAFFAAAKCVWLLHLLAFSFRQPLVILRVDENVIFESNYMEDIFGDRLRSEGPGRVKVMVMPGFYILDSVLKCKVLCRYKSVS